MKRSSTARCSSTSGLTSYFRPGCARGGSPRSMRPCVADPRRAGGPPPSASPIARASSPTRNCALPLVTARGARSGLRRRGLTIGEGDLAEASAQRHRLGDRVPPPPLWRQLVGRPPAAESTDAQSATSVLDSHGRGRTRTSGHGDHKGGTPAATLIRPGGTLSADAFGFERIALRAGSSWAHRRLPGGAAAEPIASSAGC